MKNLIRVCVAALALACCVAAAVPVLAAPVTDGSFHYTTKAKAAEKLSAGHFDGVTVNTRSHAVRNVYDKDGNLIPATMSSDGHWFLIPTNEGYHQIPTGY